MIKFDRKEFTESFEKAEALSREIANSFKSKYRIKQEVTADIGYSYIGIHIKAGHDKVSIRLDFRDKSLAFEYGSMSIDDKNLTNKIDYVIVVGEIASIVKKDYKSMIAFGVSYVDSIKNIR